MNARETAAYEAALGRFADYTDPKPRLERLYTDARRAWLDSRGPAHDLHRMLVDLAFRKTELTQEEDESLRNAHGIARREA